MSIPPFPFYFIRHGETDWNRSNRIMGHKDIPLNEKGIAQSHHAKALLKNVEFGKIWSSPFQRARQTAEIINESFCYPIDYTDYLKERGWGVGEGHSHESLFPDLKPDFRNTDRNKDDQLPKGAEPYSAFEGRIIGVFREILIPGQKPPLVVGHGGIFRVLTKLLSDSSVSVENCVPYFFRPPEDATHPWFIANVGEEGIKL